MIVRNKSKDKTKGGKGPATKKSLSIFPFQGTTHGVQHLSDLDHES